MTRVQILLTAEENRRLKALAQIRRESKSSLVRRGLNLLFRAEAEPDDAILGLIAQAGRSRQQHVARRHDRVLFEDLLGERPNVLAPLPDPVLLLRRLHLTHPVFTNGS